MTLPLVSICIPTYNGAAYITEALESAIQQTYPHLEIVISDDASTDATLTIVESFKTKTYIPISVCHHAPKGIGANWNHSVMQAKGDYIKFLFQDDVLAPDCISKLMDLALTNSNVGLVYSKRTFIYNALTPKLTDFINYYGNLHEYWESFTVQEGVLSGKVYLKDRQLLNSPKNKIGEPTNVLLKKECFNTIGYFSEELQQALDSDYWYRVMTLYDIGFVDDTLARFRLHDAQASVINKQRAIPDRELVYKRYYDLLYRYLHIQNKRKLLKLYHPVFKGLVTLKRALYGKH